LTRDGKRFGHRTHSRAGQAAPGFIWSRFDEVLDDEPQPLWVAVMLWGEVQIRMTIIRPTFPVMAFEAPGALGCEQPAKLLRHSDNMSGWEYAQTDGRAVSIQRLMGYDAQRASAPFLDQSNINLAYTYSEQPLVCESQPSVAARCLASAALVRPGTFNPADEFAGIKVEIETSEIFRVTLPAGRLALIAPGETAPKRARLNGAELEGKCIRYVQMTEDLNEVCGLGLTRLSGLASFSEPGAFRLRRTPDGVIRVTTNTGISLAEQWLGRPTRRIEALTLDNQWLEVTADCRNGSIPVEVVQQWKERNQRTSIDFRINA
jgi:hypothetical protein